MKIQAGYDKAERDTAFEVTKPPFFAGPEAVRRTRVAL